MTKDEFIAKLKQGLDGLDPKSLDEILADYQAHFSDGLSAGRSEAEVASALGDPERLARELRAESQLKQWEANKTPNSALTALFALIGLGALDVLFLLPLILAVAGTLLGFFAAAIAFFIAGGVFFVVVPFVGLPGGALAALLGGLALMALAVTITALTAIASIWLFNGIVWFARLHYRLIKPAISQVAQ